MQSSKLKPTMPIPTLALLFTIQSVGGVFLAGVFRRRRFGDFRGINRPTRHPVFFAGPFVEINQLASFRTEWPPGIVFPLRRFSAGRTFQHMAKVES